MSWYISRAFSSQAMTASRSSLDLAVGAQAEVVGDLADLVQRLAAGRALDDLAHEAVAQVTGLLEALHVDAADERGVLLVQLRAGEQGVEHPVQVLRDRALLRAGRLAQLLA
jgi:hypothetical protein